MSSRNLHYALLNYINRPGNNTKNSLIRSLDSYFNRNKGPEITRNNNNNRNKGPEMTRNNNNRNKGPEITRNNNRGPYKRTFMNGKVIYTNTNNPNNRNYYTRNNNGKYFRNNKQYYWNSNERKFKQVSNNQPQPSLMNAPMTMPPTITRNYPNQPFKRIFSNGKVLYTKTNNLNNTNYYTKNGTNKYTKNGKYYQWVRLMGNFKEVNKNIYNLI
jgi:hypothetical protein